MNPWPTDPADTDYDEWLNDLLDKAPDHYDGDDAAEAIVTRYVHDLEAVAQAARDLLPALHGERKAPLQCAVNDLDGTWED